MKKLSAGNKKSNSKIWFLQTGGASVLLPTSTLTERKGMGKQGIRRINMLNKLFMRNITDLMATGSMAEELLGNGIQISRVKVTPDFNQVNVYWATGGGSVDTDMEKLLRRAVGYIKHELSQLRVIGVVPHISFVRDIKMSKISEVEELLKTIDFGEDYQPTDQASRLKTSELELHHSLSAEIVEKINELDADNLDGDNNFKFPEMRNDVYGLDHSGIMQRVCRDIKRVQVAWETYETKNHHKLPVKDKQLNRPVSINDGDAIQERLKRYLSTREITRRPRRTSWRRSQLEEDEVEDEPVNFRDDDYIVEDETKYKRF